MTIRPILIFPDKRLRAKATEITEFDETVHDLAQDLFNTMYDAPGIGLAANQIGVFLSMFVMDCSAKEDPPAPRALVNPAVVWSSEDKEKHEEGCLSFPGQLAEVARPASVEIESQDLNGVRRRERFDGFPARCAQHEIDHLNGVLFIDRMSLVKRRIIIQKMAKLQRRNEPG